MGDAALRISLAATGASEAIEGRVRITGSDLFCATLMPGIVATLHDRAPALEIEVVASLDDAAIVTAIIVMAHTLGLRVVAEGVEREDQLEFLTDRGCDHCGARGQPAALARG